MTDITDAHALSDVIKQTFQAEAERRAAASGVPVDVVSVFLAKEIEQRPTKIEYADLPHLNLGEMTRVGEQRVLRLNWRHVFIQWMWGDHDSGIDGAGDEIKVDNLTSMQRSQIEIMLWVLLEGLEPGNDPEHQRIYQREVNEWSRRLAVALPILLEIHAL